MTLRKHRIAPSRTASPRTAWTPPYHHPQYLYAGAQYHSTADSKLSLTIMLQPHGTADEVNSFVGCTLLIQVMQYDGTVPCAPFQSMDRGHEPLKASSCPSLVRSKRSHASTRPLCLHPVRKSQQHQHGAESRRHGCRVSAIKSTHSPNQKLTHDLGSTRSSPSVFLARNVTLQAATSVRLTSKRSTPTSRPQMSRWTLLQMVESQMNRKSSPCAEWVRTYLRQPT